MSDTKYEAIRVTIPHANVTSLELYIEGLIFLLNSGSAPVTIALTAQSNESAVEVMAASNAHNAKAKISGLVRCFKIGSKGLDP